jgi:AcrR family transcriptional regulator
VTVNHEERRQEIAEVTAKVIALEGLEAATIRRISAEFEGVTKAVTYYFSDKQELLRYTWEYLAQQYLTRLSEGTSGDLVDALLTMTASDERSMLRWRVHVAFWELAARDPACAESQRRYLELALARIGDLVRAIDPTRTDIERVSLHLNALVHGISSQTLIDPQRWPAERIRAALADQVQMLLKSPEQSYGKD